MSKLQFTRTLTYADSFYLQLIHWTQYTSLRILEGPEFAGYTVLELQKYISTTMIIVLGCI